MTRKIDCSDDAIGAARTDAREETNDKIKKLENKRKEKRMIDDVTGDDRKM